MPSKKRNLEKVEQVANASSLYEPPRLMSVEDMLHWYSLLDAALADRQANATHEPIPNKPRSAARIEFDEMIFRIADKIKDAPPLPVPPLVLSCQAARSDVTTSATVTEANADDVPLHELLSRLMRKVES